jgi:hypothetical protein
MTSHSRIDAVLRTRLESDPSQLRNIAVEFTELPGDDELAELGLAVTGVNPAIGMADAQGVRRIAERPDVVRISLEPESELF